MQTIILVPAIMAVTIGSVVGVRAIYRAVYKNDDAENNKTMKWNVEEFTANLSRKGV